MATKWHDMHTEAESLKELYERLDTIWTALDPSAVNVDYDITAQEFLAFLDDLARGAQSSAMWALVAQWAGEKA
jgi:hypothetical protein